MKNIIQRGLPLHKYELVGIIHTPIEDGGSVCENCGKTISNIASIKDENGKHHHVGMDCLETIQQSNSFLNAEEWVKYEYVHKAAFSKAKQRLQTYVVADFETLPYQPRKPYI